MMRREPRPWKQVFAGASLFTFAQFAGVVLMLIVTLMKGDFGADGTISAGIDFSDEGLELSGPDAEDLYANAWPGFPIGLAAQALISVIGFFVMIPKLTGRKPYELMGPRVWREFGAGLGLGALPVAMGVAIVAMIGSISLHNASLNTGIISGLMIGIGAGFAEEIFFRGFLLRLIDKRFGSWVALISISLLFGLIHISNPGASLWGAVAITMAAGPLLNAAYLLTRRLWLPIGIHVAWNAVQSAVFGIDVSGIGSGRGLFESTHSGPDLLSGGSMGIEGSVVLVAIGLAFGVAITILTYRAGRMLPRRT
ncbi:MAG: CPBP family intramembrane metalloprotease [Thermomicrobiales bacterium]